MQGSGVEVFLQVRHAVQPFPGEVRVVAAEVTVRRRLGVDGPLEVQCVNDGARTEVEQFVDRFTDAGRVNGLRAEGLNVRSDRACLADGVGNLDLGALGQSGGHHVLGNPPHGVSGRTVHLGRILAGESSAAVAGESAVGVHDDLAAGEAGVAYGTADDEGAGRVQDVCRARDVQVGRRQDGVDDVAGEVRPKLLKASLFSVLAGDDHRFNGNRPIAVVPYGDLGLAVRAKVGQLAVFTDFSETFGQDGGRARWE